MNVKSSLVTGLLLGGVLVFSGCDDDKGSTPTDAAADASANRDGGSTDTAATDGSASDVARDGTAADTAATDTAVDTTAGDTAAADTSTGS